MVKIIDILDIVIFASILFVQEYLLSFLPNIQLTFFLIIFYSIKLPLYKTILIIIIHTTLDNLLLGPFNILFYIVMLIAYLIIPLTLKTIFKRVKGNISLAFLGILYSLIFSYLFIIPSVLIHDVDFVTYLLADIIFEVILALSTFISVLLLYEPLNKFYDKIYINR